MFKVVIRRDSIREPLVSEAITLRTEKPPSPKLLKLYLCGSTNLRMAHHSLRDDRFAKKAKNLICEICIKRNVCFFRKLDLNLGSCNFVRIIASGSGCSSVVENLSQK